MSRQKILRRKITVTIPYTDLTSGYQAKTVLDDIRMKLPQNWTNLVEHPGAEVELGPIEETTREAPKVTPAPEPAPAVKQAAE